MKTTVAMSVSNVQIREFFDRGSLHPYLQNCELILVVSKKITLKVITELRIPTCLEKFSFFY